MDITIGQYNAVIDGLRTQLELQRGVTLDTERELSCLRLLRAGDQENLRQILLDHETEVKEYAEIRKEDIARLLAVERVARGDDDVRLVNSLDADYTEAYRLVCSLVEAHDAAMREVCRIQEEMAERSRRGRRNRRALPESGQ